MYVSGSDLDGLFLFFKFSVVPGVEPRTSYVLGWHPLSYIPDLADGLYVLYFSLLVLGIEPRALTLTELQPKSSFYFLNLRQCLAKLHTLGLNSLSSHLNLPECWDDRPVPPCLACMFFLLVTIQPNSLTAAYSLIDQ